MNNIRLATISDYREIAPIFNDYRVHFGGKSDVDASAKFLFQRFERRDSLMFIYEEGGNVLGIAHLYPSYSSLSLQSVWILNDFYIVEQHRNNKIGARLFDTVKSYVQETGAKGIELSVEHINDKGWRFWERQGFDIDTEFRYYFLKTNVSS